jgi:hypothetical protein
VTTAALVGALALACDGTETDAGTLVPKLRASTAGELSYVIVQDGPAIGGALRQEITGEFDDVNADMSDTVTGPNGKSILLRERIIRDDLYLALPKGCESRTHGKTWVLWSLEESAEEFLPQGAVAALGVEDAPGRLVRRENLGGVATTHYVQQTQTKDMIDADLGVSSIADPADKDRLARALESRQAPVHVWVDDDGVLRKLQSEATFAFTKASGIPGWHQAYTMEWKDHEITEPITPPPADDVDRSSDLLKQIEAERSGEVGDSNVLACAAT